jgi:hypothetical protein
MGIVHPSCSIASAVKCSRLHSPAWHHMDDWWKSAEPASETFGSI